MKSMIRSAVLAFVAMTTLAQKSEDMTKCWDSSISSKNTQAGVVQNWRDMGFGIFIHWTPAIVFQGRAKGKELDRDLWGEWYMRRSGIAMSEYVKRARTWNPQEFDATAWAKTFKDAGAKYVVFVAKHHDGFALFDSQVNDYNIAANKDFGRDPFGELCGALRKEGVRTGFYYSHGTDWRNRSCFKGSKQEVEDQYWNKVAYPHLRELCEKYGEQDIVWFDLGTSKEQAEKCAEIVKKKNPNMMISSRIGHGYGNFSLGGDCEIPIKKSDKPWETCMTFNWHWDWYPADRATKSSQQLIRMLATIRSRGGNLLLNVGPDVRGVIPLRESIVLAAMGRWLRVHGDSIYAARLTSYNDLPWGVCTMKKGRLFMHLFKLPRLDYAFLPGFSSPIKKAYLLADKTHKALKVEKAKYGYKIYLKGSSPYLFNEADTVVVVEYDGMPKIDSTPVLDLDLENSFIPAFGRVSGGAHVGHKRITPKPDNPSVEAPHYFNYADKFASPESKVTWNCITPETTHFYVKVKYANFTEQTLTAFVKVGGNTVRVQLPPSPKNVSDCIQRSLSKAFLLHASADTSIEFSLAKESLQKPLTGQGPSKLPVFMLESVEVSTVNLPLYTGFGKTDELLKESRIEPPPARGCLKIRKVQADSAGSVAPPENIFDGNPDTFWQIDHQHSSASYPHHVDFAFEKPGNFRELVIYQRNDGSLDGMVKHIELYVSRNGRSWGKPIGRFELKAQSGQQVIKLKRKINTRFARIKILDAARENDPEASLAEVAFR